MNLQFSTRIPALCLCVILACGCGGEPPAHPPFAALRATQLDSVIRRCREGLVADPDDAALHVRLAGALLDRAMLHDLNYHNLIWSSLSPFSVALADVGRPVDSLVRVSIRDTLAEAESHAAKALALKPGDPRAMSMTGRLFLALGWPAALDSMLAGATAQFESSIALDSTSAETYYGLGCALFARNRSAEALAALNKSVSLDSSVGTTYLTMGEVYYDTRNTAYAFACYENAARLGLKTSGEYLQLAYHYTDETAERKLLGRLASLRRDVPAFFKPLIRAGLNAASLYHPAIAMDLATRALEVDSSCAEAYLFRSRLYLEEGDTVSATDEYLEAIKLGSAPFYSYARFPGEIREFARRRMPDDDVSLSLFSFNSGGDTKPDSIPAPLLAAVRQRPGSALAAYLVGEAYRMRRDTAEAVRWFDRVVSMPPIAYPNMYSTIQQTYMDAGLIPRAVQLYDRYFFGLYGDWFHDYRGTGQTAGRHSKEVMRLAASYCAVGRQCSWSINRGRPEFWKGEAIKQFQRAMALVPESPVPYVCLGDLYTDLGQKGDALRYYRQAASRGSKDAAAVLRKAGGRM